MGNESESPLNMPLNILVVNAYGLVSDYGRTTPAQDKCALLILLELGVAWRDSLSRLHKPQNAGLVGENG